MSREIQYDSTQRAVVNNLYAAIFNAQLQVWNGSTFVELSTAPLAAACLVQLGELGAGPLYAADMPEGIVTLDPSLAGVYYCQFFDQSSASIASPAVLTALTAVGEQILASDAAAAIAATPVTLATSQPNYAPAKSTDVTSALAACGLAPVATLTVTSNTGSATTFNVTGIAPFWTGPIIGLTGANAGAAGNITNNLPGSGSNRILTVQGLSAAPVAGETFAAVNLATAANLAVVATSANSAVAAAAAATNAGNFTGTFPSGVVSNCPTGPTYKLSGVVAIGDIVPLPVVLQQYCAINVTIPLAAAIAPADTVKFAVTSMSDRGTILWEYPATVASDGKSVAIAADNSNTQTVPPNGWYWYLVDTTTKLSVGEGPLTLEAGPLVT